jgi:hypothetical protein
MQMRCLSTKLSCPLIMRPSDLVPSSPDVPSVDSARLRSPDPSFLSCPTTVLDCAAWRRCIPRRVASEVPVLHRDGAGSVSRSGSRCAGDYTHVYTLLHILHSELRAVKRRIKPYPSIDKPRWNTQFEIKITIKRHVPMVLTYRYP